MEPSWNLGLRVAGDGAWGGGAASAACLGVCACCSEELRAPNCAISGVKKGHKKKISCFLSMVGGGVCVWCHQWSCCRGCFCNFSERGERGGLGILRGISVTVSATFSPRQCLASQNSSVTSASQPPWAENPQLSAGGHQAGLGSGRGGELFPFLFRGT